MPVTDKKSRNLAAVSYIPPVGLIALYGHWPDRFVRFHALQGSILALYFFIAYFVPFVGPYLALLIAAVMISGFIHAAAGKDYRVFGLGHALEWIAKK
jgi:uncharacterized membrane protein